MAEARGNPGRAELPLAGVLTFLALATVVLARGLAQSLPGAFAGTDHIIRWVNIASDYASQLCALSFAVVCVRMVLLQLGSSQRLWLKLLVALTTLATVSAVYVSADATYRPHPSWLVLMGGCLALLALAVAARALSQATLRGPALVLACTGVAGALHLFARWLLVDGDAKELVRLFATARVLATAAFLAEVAALVLAMVWFASGVPKGPVQPRNRLAQAHWLWAIGAVVVAFATALGFAQGEEGWRLLLARTLTALGTHPDPLVAPLALHVVDLLVLGLGFVSLLPWTRPAAQRAAIALVLLGRASFDVPLAGLLVLTGLLTVVAELPLPVAPSRARSKHLGPRAESQR